MCVQLEKLVQAALDRYPGSGDEGWSASAAGVEAKKVEWDRPADYVCESNEGLLAFIDRRGNDSDLPVRPTAREVQSSMKRFAGECF